MRSEETVKVATPWTDIISINILMSLCRNTVKKIADLLYTTNLLNLLYIDSMQMNYSTIPSNIAGTSLLTNYQTRERMSGPNSHPVIPLMHPIFGYIPGNVLFHLSSLRFLILTPFPLSYHPDLRRTWSVYPYSVRPRHQSQLIKRSPHQLNAQLIPPCVPTGKLQTGCAFFKPLQLVSLPNSGHLCLVAHDACGRLNAISVVTDA